jgi:hypothetical protein
MIQKFSWDSTLQTTAGSYQPFLGLFAAEDLDGTIKDSPSLDRYANPDWLVLLLDSLDTHAFPRVPIVVAEPTSLKHYG